MSWRRHAPELALLALGIFLRASMLWTFDPTWGYDYESHSKYVEWFTHHFALPEFLHSRATYHPPLFYFLAGLVMRAGGGEHAVAAISVVAGCARLALTAIGLILFLPEARLARAMALGLAALTPVSVHVDAMINGEALLGLLAAAALLAGALALRSSHHRWSRAAAFGVLAGLALLTKISALVLLAAFAAVSLAELRAPGGRLRRAAPLALALACVVTLSGWYFARNRLLYGKTFLSGFDGKERYAVAAFDDVPLLRLRPPGYLFGWSADIYRHPYWPSAVEPTPRFFPLLVATTFADYFNYHFSPLPRFYLPGPRGVPTETATRLARASVAGGTVLAATAVLAFFGVLVGLRRRRDPALAFLLLVPLFGLAAQLAIAWRYPLDWLGPVKGAYLQFAAPVLCALVGVAVEWLWRRRSGGRALAAIIFAATAAVAAYTLYCRIAWLF